MSLATHGAQARKENRFVSQILIPNPSPKNERGNDSSFVVKILRFQSSSLSSARRRGDSLDDQPQRERHFEHEHRQPHQKGHVDESDEPQGKSYQEQRRGDYAQPGQRQGNAPSTQEEIGEERAAHDEAERADVPGPASLI